MVLPQPPPEWEQARYRRSPAAALLAGARISEALLRQRRGGEKLWEGGGGEDRRGAARVASLGETMRGPGKLFFLHF